MKNNFEQNLISGLYLIYSFFFIYYLDGAEFIKWDGVLTLLYFIAMGVYNKK